jgi:cytochrome P450
MQQVAATEMMEGVRRRRREEGPIYWFDTDLLAVFDAQTAQRLDAANFSDLTLLDGFTDVVLGRQSEPVTWNRLRSAWSTQMRELCRPEGLRALAGRMQALLDTEGSVPQDLVWLAERLTTASLVPVILGGLKPAALARVIRSVHGVIGFVFSDVEPPRSPRRQQLALMLNQLVAGLTVRRELFGRRRGRRPRQLDLADPVVDMIPELGIGRAVDVVTSLLIAITGSPGAVAACLLFELSRQHEWRERIEAEFAALAPDALHQSPTRAAPLTTRFVKEVMRLWGSPSVVIRDVRTDIELGDVSLKTGQRYMLSPYMLHNDGTYWNDPDVFDPDRWLSEAPRGKCPHGAYVPFGWAPKSCVGANLGLAQLVLLAHLLSTRYRIRLPAEHQASMIFASVVRPMDFFGAIVRR